MDIKKAPPRPPGMPPLPSEARPLYEILPEVKQKTGASDIYAPGHGYAMPVNIQKNIDISKPTEGPSSSSAADKEKEEAKKKQEKKDKYKVKF
jgi:hypothetical protein